MHVRSLTPVERIIGGIIIISLMVFILLHEFLTPDERCQVAKAKIEIYEQALMDPEQYVGPQTRTYLIRARIQEIKWCEHPLSRGN